MIAFAILAPAVVVAVATSAEILSVNGSTTVNLPVAEAAEVLRKENGIEVRVDTQGGSSGGISALGDGLVEVAMSSKPLTDEDRRRHPGVDFRPVQIGADAVALVVSRDVWEGGVRSISKEEMRGIYEQRLTNWSELGGPDRRIVFFNKEPGRGTWEVFAHWLYGNPRNVPMVAHLEVGANEEARTKVAGTRGALSQLSASWADRESVFPLGLRTSAGGGVVEATAENAANGRYPMSRPLFVVTDGEPVGTAKQLIGFLLSPRGQEIVSSHGYLPMDALRSAGTSR